MSHPQGRRLDGEVAVEGGHRDSRRATPVVELADEPAPRVVSAGRVASMPGAGRSSRPWRVGIVTVSDRCAYGRAVDVSGDLLVGRLSDLPATVVSRQCVPDDPEAIRRAVATAAAATELVVLTGGTGIGPRDRTPEALRPLLEYEVPGMAEAMRATGLRHTPHAMLSRQLVGVVQGRLVMALPGSARAAVESLEAVWEALPHALALLAGETEWHPPRAGCSDVGTAATGRGPTGPVVAAGE